MRVEADDITSRYFIGKRGKVDVSSRAAEPRAFPAYPCHFSIFFTTVKSHFAGSKNTIARIKGLCRLYGNIVTADRI